MEATTSQVVAICDECGTRYRVAAENAGKRLKCKKCGLIVTVPLDAAAPRAPASPKRAHRHAEATQPRSSKIVPPTSSRAASSVRERAEQRHEGFHFGPMQMVLVGAVAVVFVLYKMLAH